MAKKKQKPIELLEPILREMFGLERLRPPQPTLSEWLSADGLLSHEDSYLLNKVLPKIIDEGDSWNDEELKMQFISIISFLADFDPLIRTSYDREIGATFGEHYLGCKPDMMLSKGIGEMIKTPYFFLHEYKHEKKYSGDPIGQMLGAMLVGQIKNANKKPVYGCYVQGRYWYFSVLEGQKYTISNGFNSSETEDAQKIVFVLRKMNEIILERLMG